LGFNQGMAMLNKSHADLVTAQFGPRATAYVSSAVHAAGADLDRLAAILSAHPAARVLDLGCGGGHVTLHAAPHVRNVVAYDLSREMLDAAASISRQRGHANVTTQQGAAENLPFEDDSFDFVISRYSAHHWHDFQAALRQARRVLKHAGLAIFIDVVSPNDSALLDTYLQAVEVLRDPSHVRDYSQNEWKRALADAGFAPSKTANGRFRLEFSAWVERIGTPPLHIEAIHSLQSCIAKDAVDYFEIEADGSFSVDTMMCEARRTEAQC
jgi:SAM-dependent methyltransferase